MFNVSFFVKHPHVFNVVLILILLSKAVFTKNHSLKPFFFAFIGVCAIFSLDAIEHMRGVEFHYHEKIGFAYYQLGVVAFSLMMTVITGKKAYFKNTPTVFIIVRDIFCVAIFMTVIGAFTEASKHDFVSKILTVIGMCILFGATRLGGHVKAFAGVTTESYSGSESGRNTGDALMVGGAATGSGAIMGLGAISRFGSSSLMPIVMLSIFAFVAIFKFAGRAEEYLDWLFSPIYNLFEHFIANPTANILMGVL